jgi:hypothetical protein
MRERGRLCDLLPQEKRRVAPRWRIAVESDRRSRESRGRGVIRSEKSMSIAAIIRLLKRRGVKGGGE